MNELLGETVGLGVPVIAAGAIGDREAVRRVLGAGAVAAQVGTALLLSDEAGTNAAHRSALRDPRFTDTIVTNCFSGRYARSLANDFTARYDAAAPLGYPQLHQITPDRSGRRRWRPATPSRPACGPAPRGAVHLQPGRPRRSWPH